MDRPPADNHQRHPLAWIPEIVQLGQRRVRGQVRLLGLAMLVGVVAGLGAIVFYVATRVAERLRAGRTGRLPSAAAARRGGGHCLASRRGATLRPWLLLLVPAIGGLLSGCWSFTLCPEAEGHGTDAVIAAYHRQQGKSGPACRWSRSSPVRLRSARAARADAKGRSPRSGPGFGSLLGNLLQLRPAERRVLMAAGMGAGIAAIFRAPLAGTHVRRRGAL